MVKIVQIGCGHWGKNLTRNLVKIGALSGVVDDDAKTAEKLASEYGIPVMSFEEAINDVHVDGISLATPAETHAALATRALEAGKHVYVEKPLALNIDDAVKMIKLANKLDRRLMVGHLLRYHPTFIALKAHVHNGLIGDLKYMYSNRMSLGKFRTEENVLWSFAPHDFSMLLGLAGEEPSLITAQGASFITPGIADWVTLQLVFPSGVRGHIQTSWVHPFKEQRLVVIGTKGMLVFDDSIPDWKHKLAHYPHVVNTDGPVPMPEKADAIYLKVEKGDPLMDECLHFVACIASKLTPRTDGREGLAVLRSLSAAEVALQKSLDGGVL